ncbi:addiction module component [Francisella sp. Scap27]|uniref:RelA/SpoT domain-containing protein n=1 Tax=Francisella sp. Scap27 TaxID=2589986 RepID=UPI0015BDD8CF|nr:RelA/SpoT domain-containing protein [Francisella sp. Scap27]QLE78596.1 addiction module component [Francisella sp. Scap27]
MDIKNFLEDSNISSACLKQANISEKELSEIISDYLSRIDDFKSTASYLANTLQQCDNVHSVRWRVKDATHLLKKIVRKKKDGNKKYTNISVNNYLEIITDLIGIRALHLFKNEWEDIYHYINQKYETHEKIVYVRKGDNEVSEHKDCEVKEHPIGYRSTHYVIKAKPLKEEIFCEIQVRTIFEEGWSEIDHRVRYPDFSDDKSILHFLTVFNRFAGSADEMASFLNNLVVTLKEERVKQKAINNSNEARISNLNDEVEHLKIQLKDMSSNKVVLSDKKAVNQDFDNLFSRIANIQNSIKTISNNDASKAVNDFGLPVINADILASALQDTDVLFNASKILEELCPDINIDEVTKSIELTDIDDKDQDKE